MCCATCRPALAQQHLQNLDVPILEEEGCMRNEVHTWAQPAPRQLRCLQQRRPLESCAGTQKTLTDSWTAAQPPE